jgi:hypothetical protein
LTGKRSLESTTIDTKPTPTKLTDSTQSTHATTQQHKGKEDYGLKKPRRQGMQRLGGKGQMVMVMTESSEGEIDVRGSSSFHCFARDEMTVKGGDCELSAAVAGFDFEFDSEFGLLSLRVWPDSVSSSDRA